MLLNVTPIIGQRQSVAANAQLQQAICLLQLSNHELQSFIETEAAENPFLETDIRPAPQTLSERAARTGGMDLDEIGARTPDHAPSLYAYVAGQFDVMFPSAEERLRADIYLEAIEPSGWLGEPLDDLALRAGIDLDEAEAFLRRVQEVEPKGLFARSLAECLALQAQDAGVMTPAFQTLLEHLPRLAAADLEGLCRICRVDMDELKSMLRVLRGFDPKPGASFDAGDSATREPDLIVTRDETGWRVDLNRSTTPSVIIDETRAVSLRRDPEAGKYAANRLSTARWLRRAVEHRNQTTLLVGAEIVRRQDGYLRHGPSHIVPMTLRDVAETVGVHESTVSRVTTGILIQTPQGTLPLKSFFSTALESEGEGAASSAAVRHRIAELVRGEDPANPLSDDALAAVMAEEGTRLARRTVAKYREMLGIPSSFQRRRLARLKSA